MFWAKAFVNVLLLSTSALAAPRRQHNGNHDIEKRASSYWMENIQRQGTVAFGANPSYSVFRNVKDFGAAGDGSTDDTAAINNAITAGNRCGEGCNSSTTTPAIVYFPAGTYRITAPLVMYYYTAMIGDATDLPTIRGDASFSGIALLDSDPYIPGANGAEWYVNQNQFFRQVRNLVIDLTQMPPGAGASGQVATGIHWQVAQACTLQNVQFNMVPKSQDNKQQGIMMENGSGMFFSNVSFSGGNYGIYGGTQQMTTRDVTFNGQNTAIMLLWDWLWTFKSLTINDCDVGVNMSSLNWTSHSQTVGSVTLMDSVVNANVMGVATAYDPANNIPATGGTLLIQNVDFSGMGGRPAVANDAGTSILPGGSKVAMWGQGHAYMPPNSAAKVRRLPQTGPPAWPSSSSYVANTTSTSTTTSPNTSISFTTAAATGTVTASTCNSAAVPATLTTISQAGFAAPTIPAALLDSSTGGVFERNKPQYETVPVGNFVSVKSQGAKGDGVTDDSDAIQAAMTSLSSDQILYFDHGAYRITKTINVPKNIKMTGEIWPLIMFDGSSATFSDVDNPQPGFRIGNSGDSGAVEITDLIFETMGPAPGCIMMEWNVEATSPGAAAMWDTHFRVGGSAGTELQQNTCEGNTTIPAQFNKECYGSFLMLHITQTASAYIENTWYWLADHELDMQGNDELNIFNGRGVLIESQGPTWLVGTSSEHSVLYNYQVANAKNLWMGAIQTETPYFQSTPDALNGGFTPNAAFSDPTFDNCGPGSNETCKKAWGLRVVDSTDVFITGAGLYSFYEQDQQASCLAAENCQNNMVDIECSSNINIYDLVTKASVNQVMVNGQSAVSEFDNVNLFGATVLFYEQQ